MDDIKDLYDLIPEGMFSNQKELEELIAKEGIGSAYELVPEGMFSNQDEFMAEFNVKKKKKLCQKARGFLQKFYQRMEKIQYLRFLNH